MYYLKDCEDQIESPNRPGCKDYAIPLQRRHNVRKREMVISPPTKSAFVWRPIEPLVDPETKKNWRKTKNATHADKNNVSLANESDLSGTEQNLPNAQKVYPAPSKSNTSVPINLQTTETGTTDIAEVQMSTSGSDVANPRKEQEKIVPTFHKGSDNSLPFVHGSATIPADRVSTKQIESNTLSASRTIKGDMGEHKNSITGLESTFGRSAMYKGSSQSMVKPSSTLDTKASQKIAADSTANAKSKTGNAIARAQNKIGGSAIATAQSNQGGFAKASAKIQGARNQSQDKEKVAVATAIAGKGGRTQAEAGSDDVNVVTDVSSSVEDPDSLKNIDDELGKNT
ncbi:Uncharacterized protein YwrJ [Folsomia candida]|uniref:Uncharacterized protein YwrJ n=1 Tax=Folsomia candida TaxID=158441 RepID=A0A226EM95_FOLCA|nr:Uncharacterized protein YwrJ [Folsomia candida]